MRLVAKRTDLRVGIWLLMLALIPSGHAQESQWLSDRRLGLRQRISPER